MNVLEFSRSLNSNTISEIEHSSGESTIADRNGEELGIGNRNLGGIFRFL